jgi:hypothetical protein
MIEPIKIESDDGFLHLKDLPHNCIFNKVVTGCGGTTVVLQNAEDYVIAVPTTELIINKTDLISAGISNRTYNGIRPFGLFGRFDDSVERLLKDYLNSTGTKKIMCTYDKIPKLMEYFQPKNNRLLVDEYHCLLKAYSYRQKAIDGVLNNFRAFKSFCFMSATKILPSFKPNCLEYVREVQADWGENKSELKVQLQQTNKPYLLTANIINKYKRDGFITSKNGMRSYEAFFFINSVTDIVAILKHCNLSKDEVRIICADNDDNREKLIGYDISNSRSDNKMFNFITSKSFEGADYHSDTGICFVVSSASNPHTQASIDTDIPQIAGRIRTKTNPFRNFLVHIFNTTYKKLNLDMTYEQMEAKTKEALETAQETVELFNSTKNKKVKDNLRDNLKHDLNGLYMKYDKTHDQFEINDILPKLELYNYQVNQKIYKDGISVSKGYEDNGIETTVADYLKVDDSISTKKISFKEAFLHYARIMSEDPHSPALSLLEEQQPLIRSAYYNLGVERVRNLRYIKKSVEAALSCLDDDKTKDQKLAQLMVKLIPTATTITVANALDKMSQAYNEIGISRKPKTKDLHQWFDCSEPYSKRLNGKVKKVVDIYRSKIIFGTTVVNEK